VFGTIVQGLPVVDEIAIVPITTTQGGLTNVPVTDVVILGAQQVQ
jgi:cyclophilin family peptidyl-prolyl cis-trans isomerase